MTIDGIEHANLMAAFPDVSFYDYAADPKRALAFADGALPANYHLTFSRKETAANHAACDAVLAAGGNVAAVFSADAYKAVLAAGTYHGARVVNGDEHDYRPADGVGALVALKAKGDARHDESGFVIKELA